MDRSDEALPWPNREAGAAGLEILGETRKKDYDDPFRKNTFRNAREMQAVLGTPEDNSFVKQIRRETEAFKQQVASIKTRA